MPTPNGHLKQKSQKHESFYHVPLSWKGSPLDIRRLRNNKTEREAYKRRKANGVKRNLPVKAKKLGYDKTYLRNLKAQGAKRKRVRNKAKDGEYSKKLRAEHKALGMKRVKTKTVSVIDVPSAQATHARKKAKKGTRDGGNPGRGQS